MHDHERYSNSNQNYKYLKHNGNISSYLFITDKPVCSIRIKLKLFVSTKTTHNLVSLGLETFC